MKNIKDKILLLIKEAANKNNIKIDLSPSNLSRPFIQLGVDSLALMSMIIELENNFNVQLSDEELLKIKTINQLIEIFESK